MEEKDIEELKQEEKELLESAKEAVRNSYNPVTGVLFGAAILTESGKVYTGSNIYHSSTGTNLCAERISAASAFSGG
jgi:cytidine deaminase